jgi:hypothetical protein
MDASDEQHINAFSPRSESLEFGSDVTVESAVHPAKQPETSVSTEDGMQIDGSDEQD